jgi:hypothetical protein
VFSRLSHTCVDSCQYPKAAEWYNFRDLSGSEVLVLAIFDEASYKGRAMGDNHPIAQAQEYHRGRFS